MKYAIVISVACLMVLPRIAHAEFKGCYERVYDKAYLRKHKKQQITKIRFQYGVGKGSDGAFELLDRVDAGFRKRAIYTGNLIECQPVGEDLSCNIDSDGGTFIVTDRGESSLRITNKRFMRFGSENGTTIENKGEDKEFRLFRISETACP